MRAGHIAPALWLGFVCLLAAAPEANAGSQREDRNAQRRMEDEQRRAEEQIRSQFLSDIGRIPAGRGEGARRRDFHNDLRSFGEQIVAVWSLRLAPMPNERILEDLEDRSGDLARTVERMREYVDRDSDPPDFDPAPLTGRDLAERLDHFLVLGLQLRRGVIEVTGGEVLDFGRLNAVRADFATLESWIAEFRESARDQPPR